MDQNTTTYTLLDKVNSPRDIKGMTIAQLRTLCEEIRRYMIECCAINPGHLGSSLGAVELIVGLAAYKAGAEDTYAGDSGKREWINNNDILARQVAAARNENRYSGFALYRYDSVYNPASGVKAAVRAERENLLEIM